MARRRLTPLPSSPEVLPARPSPLTSAPIARVAGETAAEAALATLSEEVAKARAEGLMIQLLPLGEIAEDHLVRERIGTDEDEMEVLIASLEARGQQTPIDVVDTGTDVSRRYGLISGFRRLEALRRLHTRTGAPRFATIRAIVRQPEDATDAYRAMVDENEIRLGLSYWERAHIAMRLAETGLYDSPQKAILDLFATASRAKRSKINSFVVIHRALGTELRFPTALPERLGLRLARALEDEALVDQIRRGLSEAAPEDPEAEHQLLSRLLASNGLRAASPPPKPGGPMPETKSKPGGRTRGQKRAGEGAVQLARTGTDQLLLSGPGVDAMFEADLTAWLAARSGR